MPIIHNRVTDNFSVVSNNILRCKGLSWRAKGIYAYLVGCKDGWETSIEALASFDEEGALGKKTEGRDAVRAAVAELKDFGCLEIVAAPGEGGKFAGQKWIITELLKNRSTVQPQDGISVVLNNTNDNNINNNNEAFRPSVASAPLATPIETATIGTVEDQANKAIAAMYEKKVKAAEKRAKAKLLASFEPEFESIYSIWPKRPDKIEAYGCWKAAISTGISNETLLSAAKKEVENGRYCKNLLSWLQNKGWEVSPKANSNDYKPQNNRFDKPDHTKVAPQQDKRLLFLSNRYPNIPPEWLKVGKNEPEEVLAEINARWSNYSKMDIRSAICEATTQVANRYESEDIFSQMLNKPLDTGA